MLAPRIHLTTANLSGLPPVTIINAQIDPLRDDGAMLERALNPANVLVERRVYEGMHTSSSGWARWFHKRRTPYRTLEHG